MKKHYHFVDLPNGRRIRTTYDTVYEDINVSRTISTVKDVSAGASAGASIGQSVGPQGAVAGGIIGGAVEIAKKIFGGSGPSMDTIRKNIHTMIIVENKGSDEVLAYIKAKKKDQKDTNSLISYANGLFKEREANKPVVYTAQQTADQLAALKKIAAGVKSTIVNSAVMSGPVFDSKAFASANWDVKAPDWNTVKIAAKNAIFAVKKYYTDNNKLPTDWVQKVADFQKLDTTIPVNGMWDIVTQNRVSYYVGSLDSFLITPSTKNVVVSKPAPTATKTALTVGGILSGLYLLKKIL